MPCSLLTTSYQHVNQQNFLLNFRTKSDYLLLVPSPAYNYDCCVFSTCVYVYVCVCTCVANVIMTLTETECNFSYLDKYTHHQHERKSH